MTPSSLSATRALSAALPVMPRSAAVFPWLDRGARQTETLVVRTGVRHYRQCVCHLLLLPSRTPRSGCGTVEQLAETAGRMRADGQLLEHPEPGLTAPGGADHLLDLDARRVEGVEVLDPVLLPCPR